MGLSEYLEEEQEDNLALIRAEEGQLIIAQQVQQQFIDFENQKKLLEKKEKELKAKLEEVMKDNGIEKFESNDKRIMITLGKDTITETVDKDKLFLEHPDIYKECVKETSRKGSLRITIRNKEEE